MAYWYQTDQDLYAFERECYRTFAKNYNHPNCKVQFDFDKKKRFVVLLDLPFKPDPNEPWRMFKFLIVYEHDHPKRGSDGLFGGSIKIYPLTKLKPGFHHLIYDSAMGLPYICQTRTSEQSKVNGYYAMRRLLRWIRVYCVWERTGKDLDR